MHSPLASNSAWLGRGLADNGCQAIGHLDIALVDELIEPGIEEPKFGGERLDQSPAA